MEKLCVPSVEKSSRRLALKDSVAVIIAMSAMMPTPMMPIVRDVRSTWPRMDRRATKTMSRHNVELDAMAERYRRSVQFSVGEKVTRT